LAILGACFLLLILILIVYFPCPSNAQYSIFRTILAIAIAAVASIIPGFFNLKYKELISAGGALAVFAYVYMYNPSIIVNTEKCSPFTMTIFVHGSNGKQDIILQNKGEVILDLNGDRRREKINDKGEAVFKGIPNQFMNTKVPITIEADIYQPRYKDSAYTLTDKEVVYIELSTKNLSNISGSVRNEEGKLLSQVKIIVGDIVTVTNEYGRFKIDIPEKMQKVEQEMIAIKEGYQTWDELVYPQTKQEIKIILIKQ
jgi:hypothetical protein